MARGVTKQKSNMFVIILLAVLLAISLLFNFTGAWFTDTTTNTTGTTINFGTVKLETKTLGLIIPKPLLPSQNIDFETINYVGSANAYFRIYFSIAEGSYTGTIPTLQRLQETLHTNTIQYGVFDVEADGGMAVTPKTINIAQSTDNDFQNVTCALEVTIEVIQQANMDGVADPSNPTEEEFEYIFATYEISPAQ